MSAPTEGSSDVARQSLPNNFEDGTSKRLLATKTKADIQLGQSEFLKDFNPANSKRNQKKQANLQPYRRQRVYSKDGRQLSTGLDLCDCLTPGCAGCYFACPKCRSCKCGHECRKNRKWTYDCYEVQGTGIVVKRK